MGRVATAERSKDGFPRPFGKYLLLDNFARGGMGEVYLAKTGDIVGLETYCVLKKLRSELTRDGEYVRRFFDEARVVVKLTHAKICRVFEVGCVGDEYYLAMEYVQGRDVRTVQDRFTRKQKSMAASVAIHLVCEVLEALDYAHRCHDPCTREPLHVVHRDVSPQNVLVSYEGEVKLIDFGLAASRLKVERTQPNVVMGKMAYMAPEQARGDPIDSRADQFACGVLLYELLVGERFYEGMSANDIWEVAGKGGFTPRKWDKLSPELQSIIARALHPHPHKRFATCGDFREALVSQLQWLASSTGSRGLREVMSELFADEIARESDMLARFGRVSIMNFRSEFEESRTHSVSIACADDTQSGGVLVMRNEQSESSSTPMGAMPPPDDRNPLDDQNIHREPARIASAELRKESTSGEETTGTQTQTTGTEVQPLEHTMRVERAMRRVSNATLFVEPVKVAPRSRVPFVAVGIGALAVIGVAAFFSEGGADAPGPNKERAPAAAARVEAAATVQTRVDAPPEPLAPAQEPALAPIAVPMAEPHREPPTARSDATGAEPGTSGTRWEKGPGDGRPRGSPKDGKTKPRNEEPPKVADAFPPPARTPPEPVAHSTKRKAPEVPKDDLVRKAVACKPCNPQVTAFVASGRTLDLAQLEEIRRCLAQHCGP